MKDPKDEIDLEFWMQWMARMQQTVGALLGETIGIPKPKDPAISDALFDLISFDAEHGQ